MGRALAKDLLDAGCTVVLNGRDQERLELVRAQLARQTGLTVHAVAFDAGQSAAVLQGLTRIDDMAPPIDILVNNVGLQHRAPFTEFVDADWYRLLDASLSSTIFVGREVARRMVRRRAGKILNICSVLSEMARPGAAPYAAIKGTLKLLTKGMCADLAPKWIPVNAIVPGYFDTERTAPLVADEAFSAWVCRRTPAGRWDRAEDLVGALLFLSSAAVDFVNGRTFYVDGGLLAVL